MENGLTIPTITILNPETGLVDFLHYGAKPLRMVSPVVTIYGDLKDTALFTASFWNSLDDNFINRDRPKKVGRPEGAGSGRDTITNPAVCDWKALASTQSALVTSFLPHLSPSHSRLI